MVVETDGTVQMRGEEGSGIGVRVLADDGRLRLLSGSEVVGDWSIGDIGISALQDGFAIRAEGEEFILKALDDADLAEELGLVAVSPRLARKVAALHNPAEPEPPEDVEEPKSDLMAIAFAVAGVFVVLGGSFLRAAPNSVPARDGGSDIWPAFVVGGLLMVAFAYVMSLGLRWARRAALLILAGVVALFRLAINGGVSDSGHLAAYGFIAAGLVLGAAVLFSGGLPTAD